MPATAASGPPQGSPDLPGARVGAREALRSRWAFASLATLLYWFASHALRPLVTLRLDELGVSDARIGLIVAAYPLLSLFLAVPGGRMVDRVGVLRVLWVSLIGMAAAGAGYALTGTVGAIVVLQVLNGVVELFVWLALQALVSYAGTGAFRTAQLSLFSLAWGVGVAVGPTVGGAVYDRAGFAPLGWLYAGASLLALCALLVPRGRWERAAESDGRGSSRAAVRAIAARPAVKGVLLSSFVALYVNSIKTSFYPLYLERGGVSVARIGVLLSVVGVGSLVVRVPLSAMLRRWDAGRVLVWSMWVAVVAIAVTPWLIGSYAALLLAAAVMGAGYGLNPPVTVELMARHTGAGERGLAMGMRVGANRLAQVAQPLVFGGMAAAAGMAAAFPLSGVLLAGLTAWTAREAQRISSASTVEAGGRAGG